ncbi:hypothetical protein CGRA01v4_00749 [Colletotrichum graminicola]|nr:hypothetical protein CGRA01v4_00749 [Colletotrichum graminicola]
MAWYGKCGSHARPGMSKAEVRPGRTWKFERILRGPENEGERGTGQVGFKVQPPEDSNQAACAPTIRHLESASRHAAYCFLRGGGKEHLPPQIPTTD